MAATIANTKGDGSNTYLLLGPIGTGAFVNDIEDIAYMFRDVLNLNLMGSNRSIRFVFGDIWFVCRTDWKNDSFKEIISGNELSDDE
jgi:hypothetical protein